MDEETGKNYEKYYCIVCARGARGFFFMGPLLLILLPRFGFLYVTGFM